MLGLSYGTRDLHCIMWDLSLQCTGLAAPRHVESYFFDQDQTQVPCVIRRILNHWMARELALPDPSSSVPFPVTLFLVPLTKTAIPCPCISYPTLLSAPPAQCMAPFTCYISFLSTVTIRPSPHQHPGLGSRRQRFCIFFLVLTQCWTCA